MLRKRLQHLERASYVLALAAPTTSAHLQTEHARLRAAHELELPDSRADEVCMVCGTILLPGISAKVNKSTAARTKSSRPATVTDTRAATITCSACSTESKRRGSNSLPVATTTPREAAEVRPSSLQSSLYPIGSNRQAAPSRKAQSRKQRSRAQQDSLKAILARARIESATARPTLPSFQMSDFLKPT